MNILLLGGGGSNGDWQAGRLARLVQSGRSWDYVVGCSVGALNGIMYATGQTDRLAPIWTTLTNDQVKSKRRNIALKLNYLLHRVGVAKPKMAKFSLHPLYEMMLTHLINKEVLVDFECAVVIVGDKSPDRYMKYQIQKGTILKDVHIKHILASCAIPVYFDPVEVNGVLMVDGGVHQSIPIRQTIHNLNPDKITVIVCQPIQPGPIERPTDIVEMTSWTVGAILKNQFLSEWEKIEDLDVEKELHYPSYSLGNSMNFDHSKTRPNFYAGYTLAV